MSLPPRSRRTARAVHDTSFPSRGRLRFRLLQPLPGRFPLQGNRFTAQGKHTTSCRTWRSKLRDRLIPLKSRFLPKIDGSQVLPERFTARLGHTPVLSPAIGLQPVVASGLGASTGAQRPETRFLRVSATLPLHTSEVPFAPSMSQAAGTGTLPPLSTVRFTGSRLGAPQTTAAPTSTRSQARLSPQVRAASCLPSTAIAAVAAPSERKPSRSSGPLATSCRMSPGTE